MNGRTFPAAIMVAAVLAGCGDKDKANAPAVSTARPAAPAAPRTEVVADTMPPPAATPAPAPVTAAPTVAAGDTPWTATQTGTVTPGMTRDQVVATWGEPAQERAAGAWTYLFYRNGCEASCGTFDTVFLENGQVVDAVVRGPGHDYAGVSSSPRDRPAQFTPPGGGGS